MTKKIFALCLSLMLPFVVAPAWACFAHMGPGFGAGMDAYKKAEPVIKLRHARMAKVPVGEEFEIVINYARPSSSEDVTLQVTGVGEVEVLTKELELSQYIGSVKARVLIPVEGIDVLKLTVRGKDHGEPLREASAIWLSAEPVPEGEVKVSSR